MIGVAPREPRPDPRVFAALGDETRLHLLERLRRAPRLSTTALTEGTPLTRQAVTKHLRVLAEAGLVRDVRHGRERLWMLDGAPIRDVADWANAWRQHWEQRLDRLGAWLADPPTQEPPDVRDDEQQRP